MGLFGTLLSFLGFGWGIGVGLLIGYFMFVYTLPSKVEDPPLKAVSDQDPKGLERMVKDVPMWVSSPDWERVGWLNRFVRELWPFLDQAVAKTVKETVAPMIKQYKPAQVDSIEFEALTLGTLPALIDGVKVYETTDDEVILQLNVKYAGNPNIIVAAKAFGMKATVQATEVQVWAQVRVTLKPLIPVFPCFSNITISLMTKPHVDFGLKLLGGDVMAIPGLYHFAQDRIKKIVDTMLLWPHKMEIPLGGAIGTRPVGILHVKLVEGKELRKTDVFGSTDPFVEMAFTGDDKPQKSKTLKNTQSPTWNEEFQFVVRDPAADKLTLQVYDWDRTSANSKTGVAVVNVKDVVGQGERDLWLELAKTTAGSAPGDKPYGRLHVVAEYKELKDEMDADTTTNAGGEEAVERAPAGTPKGGGVLVVIVHNGQELEAKHGTPTAYVKLKYRNIEFKTKPVKKSESPEWEERFEFILQAPPEGDQLHVEVKSKDSDMLGKLTHHKSTIGDVDIPLNDVVSNRRINDVYQLNNSRHGAVKIELQWLTP
jgi:Ca2+-dependent lipid-binding protein